MDEIKKSVLLKQSKLKNKVEKMNKSEVYVLQRKLRVIDRESDHYNATVIRQKRDLVFKLKDIQKNSGHSIMSLKPEPHSKALQDPLIINCAYRLSDKQLLGWRLKEKAIQKQFRIKELEQKRERDRERSLIQLLKDLNIISEKMPIYEGIKDDEEETSNINLDREKSFSEKYPRTNELLLKRSLTSIDRIRPQTVDCAQIQRSYIDSVMTSSQFDPTQLKNRKLSHFYFEIQTNSNLEKEIINERRAKSAVSVRRPISGVVPKEEKIIVEKPITPKEKPKLIKKLEETQPVAVNNDLFLKGLSKMPKWKRQLLLEAPIGVSDAFTKSKIQVVMSQAQKRKELEELVASNVIDVEKYAQERFEEQKRKIETMQATLKEMDDMSKDS